MKTKTISLEKIDGYFDVSSDIFCRKNIKQVELFLKEYQNEKAMLLKKIRSTGTVNQVIKNEDLIDAIKLLRKQLKKELK